MSISIINITPSSTSSLSVSEPTVTALVCSERVVTTIGNLTDLPVWQGAVDGVLITISGDFLITIDGDYLAYV